MPSGTGPSASASSQQGPANMPPATRAGIAPQTTLIPPPLQIDPIVDLEELKPLPLTPVHSAAPTPLPSQSQASSNTQAAQQAQASSYSTAATQSYSPAPFEDISEPELSLQDLSELPPAPPPSMMPAALPHTHTDSNTSTSGSYAKAAAATPSPTRPAPAASSLAPAVTSTATTGSHATAIYAAAPSAQVTSPAVTTPATSGASATAASATAASIAASPTMDRDSISRNQVVERYLSGRLPLKAATDFERYCRDNPQILDELGLAERVNAGLRLLEASGKPEPWQEAKKPFWQKPQVTLVLAVAVVGLGIGLSMVLNDSSAKSLRIKKLQAQASERPLDPATSTREIRLLPSREGGSNTPAITIGGGGSTQLADLKIDESRSPYKIFRVTIDRIDQGRVAVISELGKDSNGHLRIALNSSALGPGNYQFTIEGLTWKGDAEPDSWITIGIQR